jgi:large subunit ribosomal protein L9
MLWKTIEKLGELGEVVEVKPGFARNYLLPRRLASADTPSQRQALKFARRKQEKLELKQADDAKTLRAALEKISVSLEVNTTEDGKLYGSVTPTMISEALAEQGAKVEPKEIEIGDAIKQVGYYEVTVALHRDVKPKLKVWVVSANPEAQAKPAEGAPEQKPS